jgi:hypothetical protein
MLKLTKYSISSDILNAIQESIPNFDHRLILNYPTGSFFHDAWKIKDEYKNTPWNDVLLSLKEDHGEARLIKLTPGECYPSHADIDDRWHLSITGNESYLINLENHILHKTDKLGYWYEMDAGIKHSAANFGSKDRIQLVVRKLLPKAEIKEPISVVITLKNILEDRRFIFDDILSPWLNRSYKKKIISNFKGEDLSASFIMEKIYLSELKEISKDYFNITVI